MNFEGIVLFRKALETESSAEVQVVIDSCRLASQSVYLTILARIVIGSFLRALSENRAR